MEKKEMSMEVRLLLAFGLMGLVLLVSQYFMKPVPAPPDKQTQQAKKAEAPAVAAAPASQPAAAPIAPGAAGKSDAKKDASKPEVIKADKEETVTIETRLYRVTFSNRGAVARSWILKNFKDNKGKPLEIVDLESLDKVPDPFAVAFKGQAPGTDLNSQFFRVERSSDNLGVNFTYSDGTLTARKSFEFGPEGYLVKVSSQITSGAAPLAHSLTWRGGFGDFAVQSAAAAQHNSYYDTTAQSLVSTKAGDAKDGPVSTTGQYSFVAIEDAYFAAAFLPIGKTTIEQTTYSDPVPDKDGKPQPHVGVGVGGDGNNTFSLFVGPKDTELLQKVDPKLVGIVDWGKYLGFIAKPLFMVLTWTSTQLTHNYGWAIVVVTIAINLLLFPARLSGIKSAKKMQALQPQVKLINDKYKNLGMRDPKKADQQQELMALYKANDVNVAGGCLPLLIQIPFLYAFYTVLSVSTAMRGAQWLWVQDLSQPETIALRMLPLLLIVTQFLQQKMTPPTPGMDPAQQKMMMVMPLVFGFMFYGASSGLVLYWLTGNVVGIATQWILNKLTHVPAVASTATSKPAPNKKGRN